MTTSQVGSVRAVGTVFAVAGISSASAFARTPSIRDQVSATPQLLSLALVCVGIGSIAAMPFTGRLTDRLSSAMVVRVFTLLSVVAWTLVSQAPSVLVLAPIMLIAGAGFGVWDVAMNVQGHGVEVAQSRVHMPLLHALFSFGSVAGALLGAGFARLGIPISVQFPLVGALSLITVLWATREFIDDRLVGVGSASGAAGGTAGSEPVVAKARPKIGRVEILIGLMMACTALGEGAANDWLGLTLVDTRGVAEAFGALTLGGFNLTMAIARIGGGRLIERYGRVLLLRISGLTACAGVLLVCLVDSPVTAIVGAGLWGLGLAVVFPSGVSAAGEAPGGARSIAFASTVGYGGFLFGAPLIGQLTHFVPLDRALLVVAGTSLVIALIAPVARERGTSTTLDGGAGEEIVRS